MSSSSAQQFSSPLTPDANPKPLALRQRRGGACTLAILAYIALIVRRTQFDVGLVILLETLAVVLLLVAAFIVSRRRGTNASQKFPWSILLAAAGVAAPWLMNMLGGLLGGGNQIEILMMASLAVGSLALTTLSQSNRNLGLGVIGSGFLVLFTTFTADYVQAVWFTYVWIAVCLWWLVDVHWSSVSVLTASQVQLSGWARGSYVGLAAILFILVVGAVDQQIPILNKLGIEIFPSSGGTSMRSRFARSGVGDGEALVAAKEHAAAFGAVDTDVFLDSKVPSLFDVYSDEFGEPEIKDRVEKAQALAPREMSSDQHKFAESNRAAGNQNFSIERKNPKSHQHLDDLKSNAIMFWNGPSGIRLAAQKFSLFDGKTWSSDPYYTEKNARDLQPTAIKLGEKTWFRPKSKRIQNSISPFVDSIATALRFTRFRSSAIPIQAGTQLWSIDQLDRQDFFAYSNNDLLWMPDRKHVPDYTVVRFVNSRLDLERLESLLANCSPGEHHKQGDRECQTAIAELAHQFSADSPRGLEQVQAVTDGLRTNFEWSRSASEEGSSLSDFLKNKRGPSYLFATTAALMLEHLGYETRLVTGFYVDPDNYVSDERSTAILPRNAHAWVEVHSGHGYWIPLEPTPGFQEPRTFAGLIYLAKKHWFSITLCCGLSIAGLCVIYWLRSTLFALICWTLTPLILCLPKSWQAQWLCWVLDIRWLLLGSRRSQHISSRKCLASPKWGLKDEYRDDLSNFIDSVYQIRFGPPGKPGTDQLPHTLAVLRRINSIRISRSEPIAELTQAS